MSVGVGIGSEDNHLETTVATLSANALSATAGIFVTETDDVTVDTVDVTTNRVGLDGTASAMATVSQEDVVTSADLVIKTTHGAITVEGGVDAIGVTATGDILIQSGELGEDPDVNDDHIILNASIVSATGAINLDAADDLIQNSAGDVTASGSGQTIDILAEGDITLNAGAVTTSNNGDILYQAATGDISITGVNDAIIDDWVIDAGTLGDVFLEALFGTVDLNGRIIANTLNVDSARLVVDFTNTIVYPSGGFFYTGSGELGDDVLTVNVNNGTVDVDAVTYRYLTETGGEFDVTDLSGVHHIIVFESVEVFNDNLEASSRDFSFIGDVDDQITLGDNDVLNDGISRLINSTRSGTFNFANPSTGFTLSTGGGNDTVTASDLDGLFSGTVEINGESGDDIIDAATSTYGFIINGGSGDDILAGGSGNDEINGGAEDDLIYGNAGNDTIFGNDGVDIIVGGLGADTIDGGTDSSADYVVGDVAVLVFDLNSVLTQLDDSDDAVSDYDTNSTLVQLSSVLSSSGSGDDITTGSGNDVVIGGAADDIIETGTGDDIVLGDNGLVDFTSGVVITSSDVGNVNGDVDTITDVGGDNVILGGTAGDFITTGADDDIILGDHGIVTYDGSGNLSQIASTETSDGDDDQIVVGDGSNIVVGGQSGDTIEAGSGADIILGDNGLLNFNAGDLTGIEATDFTSGGDDDIQARDGADVVIGGMGSDYIDYSRTVTDPVTGEPVVLSTDSAVDVILGDNGNLDFDIVAGVSILARAESTNTILETVSTRDDFIYSGNGADVVLGGDGNDYLNASTKDDVSTAGEDMVRDIVFGDSGIATFATGSGTSVLIRAEGIEPATGGQDTIYAENGDNVIIAGRSEDTVFTGTDNDIILGDHGSVDYSAGLVINSTDAVAGSGGIDTILDTAGDNLILGGTAGDFITTGADDDIILGDHGIVTYDGSGNLSAITSTEFTDGGVDTITDADGNDIVIAGLGDDTVDVSEGANIVIGDNGFVQYNGADGDPLTLDVVQTIAPEFGGGDDTITSGSGNDVLIGGDDDTLFGDKGDTIITIGGDNIVLGDNGQIRWHSGQLDKIESTEPDQGGDDVITTGVGNDTIVAGFGADEVDAFDGNNIVIGDSGFIDYTESTGALELITTSTVDPSLGGDDTITTGINDDIVIGGAASDTIDAGIGDNIVQGDNGFIDYVGVDGDASDIDVISTTDPNEGGADTITSGSGNDFILGGTAGDTINAGAGNDLVFGDHGKLEAQDHTIDDVLVSGGVFARALPLSGPYSTISQIAAFSGLEDPFVFTSIDTQVSDDGGNDTIYGEDGEDIILGGQGDDTIYAGSEDDDVIGGHNVAGGHDGDDSIDGGSGDDVIVGDNASVLRRGDALSPHARVLSDNVIYDDDDVVQITADHQNNPTGVEVRDIVLLDHSLTIQRNSPELYGDDYIAGGSDDDVIFGQLGDDVIQGDGSIDLDNDGIADIGNQRVGVVRNADGTLTVNSSIEAGTDGDDRIEGNGGNDVIFGNLGQDDIIGGSSALFGLDSAEARPDGEDLIFGGAGTDLERNNLGDESTEGHAQDSDVIAGDNANIYRLIGTNGVDGGAYLEFNYDYDQRLIFEDRGTERIIVRAVDLIDYTPGGSDYLFTAQEAENDQGSDDELHGESGDDFIYGQVGDDVLFGEGQDDDLIGGYGNDWISGGTGADGILGDDGRIYTSRNEEKANNNDTALSEPLYGIAKLEDVNLTIDTPGGVQEAVINVDGALKKTVNLTPFALGIGIDPNYNPLHADDILYGGLGDDSIHGGAGDDAMSGAEALSEFYAAPINPGDVLGYGSTERSNEFAAYDEFNPFRKVLIDANGESTDDVVNGSQFLLNFDALDPTVASDGDDVLFGDLGNDWIVGGTGRDHLYGGWGDDLLNADDNHDSTDDGDGILEVEDLANDISDDHPSYNDIAFGGAGRDILLANTEGDRLIDWTGNFNIYLNPFSSNGNVTNTRSVQPQLMDYLYDLSESDGADPTRSNDAGGAIERNGEPDGELGLVLQQDFAWQTATGASPELLLDVIPGGEREVLAATGFNDDSTEGFRRDSGNPEVVINGRLEISPVNLGEDAVSVYVIEDELPSYFEFLATINADKPTGGSKSNAFLIFDYQGPEDFKFAGVNISNNNIEMGRRDASGWHVDEQTPSQLKPDQDYNLLLSINGLAATLVVNNNELFSHTFEARVDGGVTYGLNAGFIGIGADNSTARIDNVVVQILPPEVTLEVIEDFSDAVEDLTLVPDLGTWGINGTRYDGTVAADPFAVSLIDLGLEDGLETSSILDLSATLNTANRAGIVFDYVSEEQFKFAAIDAVTNELVIGYYTNKEGWVDVAATSVVGGIDAITDTDYVLDVSLKGITVSASLATALNPEITIATTGYTFNSVLVDGDFGLFTDGAASYDAVALLTNDPNFVTTAVDDVVMTEMNTPLTIEVLSNDVIFDQFTDITDFDFTQSANGGMVTFDAATDTVSYTAATDFVGKDTFTYTITDGEGVTSTATVTVNVIDPNDPDVLWAVNDTITVAANSSVTFDMLANDYLGSNLPTLIISVSDASNGTVNLNNDGTITYTANAGFVGTDYYDYILTDSNGAIMSNVARVYIEVG